MKKTIAVDMSKVYDKESLFNTMYSMENIRKRFVFEKQVDVDSEINKWVQLKISLLDFHVSEFDELSEDNELHLVVTNWKHIEDICVGLPCRDNWCTKLKIYLAEATNKNERIDGYGFTFELK